MTAAVDGATVVVIGAGYPGKRRAYVRMAELGARMVFVEEPGHWSESLVSDGSPTVAADDGRRERRGCAGRLDTLNGPTCDPTVSSHLGRSVPVPLVCDGVGLRPTRSSGRRRAQQGSNPRSGHRLGLPTPKARRVRSLDELFAAAAYVGFPAV